MSKKIIAIISAVVVIIAAVVGALFFLIPKDKSPDEQVSENIIIPTSEDVQNYSPQLSIEDTSNAEHSTGEGTGAGLQING